MFSIFLFEPRHEQTCLCHMRTTKALISLRIRAVWSAALVFADKIVLYVYLLNPKFQDSSYLLWLSRPVWVLPGRYPEDEAHLCLVMWWPGEEDFHVSYCVVTSFLYEPQHDKTNKMTCAPSEDWDQPGHPPSLIRVFLVRSLGN